MTRTRLFFIPLYLPLLVLLWATPASAHAVYIFAWHDDGRICTESYFAKKRMVHNGTVTARATGGAVLASGRSDEKGLWCFAAPNPQPLTLEVNAGEGHRADFHLPAAEKTAENATDQAPLPFTDISTGTSGAAPPSPAQTADSTVSAAAQDHIRRIVREEMQAQLSPIRKALAEQNAPAGPGLRDIVGGLGWIIGLAGLAAWYTGRKRNTCGGAAPTPPQGG